MDLSDFLLARIAEDEASVRSWSRGVLDPDVSGIEKRYQAPRVLAECEAKRQIVQRADMLLRSWDYAHSGQRDLAAFPDVTRRERDFARRTLEDLAEPHADHPDFREEWKV